MTKLAFVLFGLEEWQRQRQQLVERWPSPAFPQLTSHDPPLVLERVAKRKRLSVLRLILTFILGQMYANKADTLAQNSAVIAKRSPAERVDTSPIRK
jgi:hypothetical protein